MKHFPQELVDYVLDFLHSDKASLASSSLVCTSFLHTSSFHLFADFTIRLRCPCDDGSYSELVPLRLLSRTTRITAHVKDLTIECRDIVSPARPLDVQILRRTIQSLPKLTSLLIHGLSLYHLDPEGDISLSPCMPTLKRLEIEWSRLSYDSLSVLLSSFSHIDELVFTRILSVEDLSTLPTYSETPISVGTLSLSACPRTQLSGLLPPMELMVKHMPRSLCFTNVLLDDMPAVDEHLSVFGTSLEHLRFNMPDRWFSWDPPETSVERLATHLTLPSLQRLSSLRTLDIIIPIKMNPTALHVNQLLWSRLMEMLLSIPPATTYTSSLSRMPKSRYAPASAPSSLQRVSITFGNPRWTALAEVPYVLGVIRALDWSLLDKVIEHHWPEELDVRPTLPCRSHPVSAPKKSCATAARLDLSIATRPKSRARVENAVIERVSDRVKQVTRFFEGYQRGSR